MLGIVNSRSLMNFSAGILQTLVKLVQVEILEFIIWSATGLHLVSTQKTINTSYLLIAIYNRSVIPMFTPFKLQDK